MKALKKLLVVLAFTTQVVSFALTTLILGSASTLGDVALIAKSDVLVVFFFALAGLFATLVLGLVMWRGSRRRRKELASMQTWPTAQPLPQIE